MPISYVLLVTHYLQNIQDWIKKKFFLDNLLPSSLTLMPITDNDERDFQNVNLMWNTTETDLRLHFTVSVESLPSKIFQVKTVSQSSTSLTLKNNTEYYINISICPNTSYTSQFKLGKYSSIVII